MEAYSVNHSDITLEYLAVAYRESLESSLEAKPGAISLLKYLKHTGKKVAIVTEGQEDAQEWTLEKLGSWCNIDMLSAANRFRRSKVNGTFGITLKHLNIDARDIAFVGDSLDRDGAPARAEGVPAIEFNEMDFRINSLQKLENIRRF